MSTTKHKIIKIAVSNDGTFTISEAVEKAINEFLAEANNVYVNHSVTTLTEDIVVHGNTKTICKYIVLSLVYKDLSSTSLDVKTVSKKVKNIVHKQIESGSAIAEPEIETELDKEIKKLDKKIKF